MLRYHVIPSIRLYGFMNVMSTETYETLHKSNVKNPYRSTNKKNYVLQMLKTVYIGISLLVNLSIIIYFKIYIGMTSINCF